MDTQLGVCQQFANALTLCLGPSKGCYQRMSGTFGLGGTLTFAGGAMAASTSNAVATSNMYSCRNGTRVLLVKGELEKVQVRKPTVCYTSSKTDMYNVLYGCLHSRATDHNTDATKERI